MSDEKRASGSTTCTTDTVTTVSGTGTVESAELICGCPQPGIEKIEVEQVLGAQMAQRVVEFDMFVPAQKPDIEQVIDVYVKDLKCTSINVIPDKVIIRGELEVKVMYVADLPNQPVHAFERQQVRFTRDIVIDGAEPDMKATADITVEYVDYDFNYEDDRRKVHITIVLKIWARVLTTTEMDVYALGPIDQLGEMQLTSKSGDSVSASSGVFGGDAVSASQTGGGNIVAVSPENILVTTLAPTAPGMGAVTATAGAATVTGNNVNVRTGPGTNFPVITKVNKGTSVNLLDQAFGWYRVSLQDGTTGWIASWLLSVGQPKG
ncbi:MAG: DUF3794 domain-containing protein [Negativicutes bacterium]|nr:DUF3794 domain-containing protein [Negativicutes bacterium]